MCCENEGRFYGRHEKHGSEEPGGCDCVVFGPAFWTRKEKIERLEGCLANLRERTKEVEDRLEAMKSGT